MRYRASTFQIRLLIHLLGIIAKTGSNTHLLAHAQGRQRNCAYAAGNALQNQRSYRPVLCGLQRPSAAPVSEVRAILLVLIGNNINNNGWIHMAGLMMAANNGCLALASAG